MIKMTQFGALLFSMLVASFFQQGMSISSVVVSDCGADGMTVLVTVDDTLHPAGLANLYLTDCNGFATTDNGDGTVTLTVDVATMKAGACGIYFDGGTGDSTFQSTVVVPVVSFLNTKDDLKVDVKCTFATTYVATLAPDIATDINTLAPSDQDEASTTPPDLAADIRSVDGTVLTSITVGEPMVVYVYFLNDQNGYWDSIIADKLDAYDSQTMGGMKIILVEGRCPGVYAVPLGIVYSDISESPTAEIQFNAFRFKDTIAAEVYFVVTVTVCATTAVDGTCAHDCTARKKRELSHFMHQVMHQSHKDRRSVEETGLVTDVPKVQTTISRVVRLRMVIRTEDAPMDPTMFPVIPGVIEISKNRVCIPRGTGIAVLVSLLVLAMFIATMTLLCFYMMRRRNKNSKTLSFLTPSYSTNSVSSKMTTADPRWNDDYSLHNSSHKFPLIDNDQLAAVTLRASDMPGQSVPTCPSPSVLAHEAASRAATRLVVVEEGKDCREADC